MKAFNILCIFHKETTPSLRIKNYGDFYCYGCGQMGNIKDYEELENIYNKKIYEYLESIGQLSLCYMKF